VGAVRAQTGIEPEKTIMMYFKRGSETESFSVADLRQGICSSLDRMGAIRRMLIVPPDITRFQSRAGELARFAYERDPAAVKAILPALGTHCAMNDYEIGEMFGDIPRNLFVPHNWRSDCTVAGEVPSDFVKDVSGGVIDYPIPVQVNRMLLDPSWDCILSINQVVPHEVAGMAGYSKSLFVGLGGTSNIHKSHFLGAAYGIERILGRMDSPVRKVFDYAFENFLDTLPILHVITVVGRDAGGALVTRGLFIGDDRECFEHAAALSAKVNIHLLESPLKKVVVHLDPVEYKSTWLGNKSIYRTRMAIADKGELVVLAPAVKIFGEDREIDRLIRTFGYCGTPAVLEYIESNEDLRNNLSAAAHLIHGSSEGRFSITYCPGGLSREDVEKAHFTFGRIDEMMKRYDPKSLSDGVNVMPDGEEIYYISNPAIGLWACKEKFI
jgi:nickel-dependent lactate racemase